MTINELFVWISTVFGAIGAIIVVYEKTVHRTVKDINDKIANNTERVNKLSEKHDKEVEAMRDEIKHNHEKLLNDHSSFLKQQEMNGIIMRSLSAVTHHLVDGNHQKQLEDSAVEIDDFLFEKAKTIKE
ncbi:hypothetical protein [uncultured Dubosiella sp.]|uniref:hypothetical protein n=1 Tax=uncultured Dubosiella sp. TaxID=1937011 RepID=UPI00272F8CCF|nr:hypothetical protein [uncultured Dubosiella sp.]